MNALNRKTSEIGKKYNCLFCHFHTSNKRDFNNHNSTRKHQNNCILNNNAPIMNENEENLIEITPLYECTICGKNYKNRNGLWYHSKRCKASIKTEESTNTLVLDAATVLELIKQNQEFKSLILDQQNKLIELAGKPNTVTTNNNNNSNNNNNNNTFNLQFFLNETCKDAMNITDFIENLNIQLKELENVGNNGFVTGISDIIVNRIKGLEVNKRPLHCTDVKRETMYIRDENEWNKDNDEKTKLRQFIGKVAKENMRKIPEWREQNPECQNMYDQKYEYCMQLMRHSLGDLDEKQDKMDEKIIKNIAKQVAVDKNTITYE